MQMPNNYANTQVGGGYTPPQLGGHTCVVKQVNERTNKNGGNMIVVLIDFDQADEQAGYFMDAFSKDVRPDKKYPNDATIYINVENANGECTKQFKTFCSCFEKSNNCTINWTAPDWCAQFKNKKIGAVYGLVEEAYNGELRRRSRCRWFCEYGKAKDAEAPKVQELPDSVKKAFTSAEAEAPTMMNVPDGTTDELPFA